jgi:hypothetical protein
MGPLICNGLKQVYGDKEIQCQGVGGPYTAAIMDNVSAKGTSAAAIKEATRMFTLADQKCPKSAIVFGGYRSVKPNTSTFSSLTDQTAKGPPSCITQLVRSRPISNRRSLVACSSGIFPLLPVLQYILSIRNGATSLCSDAAARG